MCAFANYKNTKFSYSLKTDLILNCYDNVKFNGTLIGNSTVHRKFIQNSDTGCWASLCNVCSFTLFLRVDRVQKERISRIPAKVCAQFIIWIDSNSIAHRDSFKHFSITKIEMVGKLDLKTCFLWQSYEMLNSTGVLIANRLSIINW